MRYKKHLLKTTTKYISSHKMLNPDAVSKVNNFISRVIYYMRCEKPSYEITAKYIPSKGGDNYTIKY